MTAIIGALVALLPPALLRPKKDQPTLESEIERLTRENKQRRLALARLVDTIEALERELLTERHICQHWKAEAERLARQSREAREQGWQGAQAQSLQPQQNGRNAMAFAQQNALLQNWQGLGLAAQQANENMQAQAEAQLGNWALNAFAQPNCNCVPSRAQVWTEEQRRNIDAVGDRIARNRP